MQMVCLIRESKWDSLCSVRFYWEAAFHGKHYLGRKLQIIQLWERTIWTGQESKGVNGLRVCVCVGGSLSLQLGPPFRQCFQVPSSNSLLSGSLSFEQDLWLPPGSKGWFLYRRKYQTQEQIILPCPLTLQTQLLLQMDWQKWFKRVLQNVNCFSGSVELWEILIFFPMNSQISASNRYDFH